MFIKKFPFIERKEKSMHIFIRDEFDLYKIIHSGQCFRAVEINDGLFRFITGRHVLYIRHIQGIRYDVSCSLYLWNHLWKPYFDLSENYEAIRNSISPNDHYLQKAADYSRGIRILRQDPWETLITFIISQRKSIPAIASAVENYARRPERKSKHLWKYSIPFRRPKNFLPCPWRTSKPVPWATASPIFPNQQES